MANLKYIGKNILNHDLILKKGDVSGSASSTGSFGNLNISSDASITGDMVVGGKLTAEQFHTEITSASIIFASGSTLFGDTQDDTHIFTGSLKVTGSVTALNLTADSSSFSTRVTNLKSDSGSFSTRVTKNEGTGSKILAGQLNFTDITATGTVQAEQLTSTDDINASGKITSNERIDIQKANAHLSLGPNASAQSFHGGVLYHDSSISSAALGNVSGFAATTSGNASNYYLLQLAGGSGMYMQVGNGGAITFPSATSFTVPLITSTGDITANGNIVGDGATNIQAINHITASGNISGSASSTGSFGRVDASRVETSIVNATDATFANEITLNDGLSAPAVGDDLHLGDGLGTTPKIRFGTSSWGNNYGLESYYSVFSTNANEGYIFKDHYDTELFRLYASNNTGFPSLRNQAHFISDVVSLGANAKISGSLSSTGSFGRLDIVDNVSATSFTGIFNGALSGSAQIASNISGAFAVASASFATDINALQTDSASFSTRVTNLKTDSGSFSTRVTNLKTDSGSFSTRITANSSSFAARDTLSEATSSKILNGELEFTNITGSGHISMSLSSTGSFGRVSATTIGGHSPLIVDSKTTFTNSITSSAHVSSSMTSTASFGRVNVVALGGHQALTIDPITTFTNVITASSAVQFDGKIFIETGSIEGDLHVRTNENLMRIGKSTSGLIVSGSSNISRFATGSDGSIIDLGFTVVDEDGNVVLAGDGDGIHVDSNNYWYNNKYYRVGDARNDFLNFNPNVGIKYSGEVIAQTGSFGGEMFINSPTGSMFIGKFTGGIPSSGSGNISRFATGSDGSIIDLGFTTTNEEGETVFLSTGDGIVRDSENYWYTTGHFKVGNGEKQIEWNTTDLNVSASTVDVTTLKASDVNFSNLPTSDPLVTGSLWVSGSSSSGSYKSGFVMISGIHG